MLQHAVNAEAHAIFFFVRLNVDVAGAALHRVRHHNVHQLYDGRFIGRFFQLGQVDIVLLGLELNVSLVTHGGQQLVDVRFVLRSAVSFFNRVHDGGFRRHHRLNVEAGHELDIVHGKHVRRVHHGNRQRRANAAERKNLVALGRLFRNQLDHGRIDFKILQVNGGNAVLPRKEIRDFLIAYKSQVDQRGTQARIGAGLTLRLQRLIELVVRDDLLFDQKIA